MLAAVQQKGLALAFASEELQSDKDRGVPNSFAFHLSLSPGVFSTVPCSFRFLDLHELFFFPGLFSS